MLLKPGAFYQFRNDILSLLASNYYTIPEIDYPVNPLASNNKNAFPGEEAC